MTLKLFKTIIEALERGCTVKVAAKHKTEGWYTISPNGNYFLDKHPVLHCEDSMIDINIVEPKAPRYPTYEEVFQWFKEGKVFKYIHTSSYSRILTMRPMQLNNTVTVGYTDCSIKEFVALFTDENGNSLMIQD